jgi:uncharacterized protein YndB with AHSA1/START domain
VEVTGNAPVVAASEIEIAAPPEAVWDVLTDFERWPSWNPDVKSLSFSGEAAEGSVFRWKAGPGTITSTIRRVDRPRLIGWTGKTLGIDAVHVYRLEPSDGGTHVTTEESYEGLVARAFRGPLRKMVKTTLDTGLERLKTEVERRTILR